MEKAVLAFRGGRLVLPEVADGFATGVTAECWVRRRKAGVDHPILILQKKEGGKIVLAAGPQSAGDLCLRVEEGAEKPQLLARGALPHEQWVRVRFSIGADGKAWLRVGAAEVASGTLPAPGASPRTTCLAGGSKVMGNADVAFLQMFGLRIFRGAAEAANLWADYAGDDIERNRVLDAGAGKRHAKVEGKVAVVDAGWRPDTTRTPALRFPKNALPVALAPLRAPSGAISIQMWVRPDDPNTKQTLFAALTGEQRSGVALVIGGGDVRLQFRTGSGDKATIKDLVTAKDVLAKDALTHVTVTLTGDRAAIYINGSKRAEADPTPAQTINVNYGFGSTSLNLGSWGIEPIKTWLKSSILTFCSLGRMEGFSTARFAGDVAELRLWRRALTDTEIAEGWLMRACGDEDGLALCYPLDAIDGGRALDIGKDRIHARVGSTSSVLRLASPAMATPDGLPVPPRGGDRMPKVIARGRLIRETLPRSLFGTTTVTARDKSIWGNVVSAGQQVADQALAVYGDTDGKFVHCNVYDAVLELKDAEGQAITSGELELRIDATRDLIQGPGQEARRVTIAAGETTKLAIPPSGKLRLRILAGQDLDCPTLRVRFGALQPGVWIPVRPAEAAQTRLAGASGGALKRPSDGRASPMPSGASDEDANAVADFLRRLGSVSVPRRATSSRPIGQTRLSWGDIEDVAEDTYEGGKDVAEDAYEGGKDVYEGGKEVVNDGAAAISDGWSAGVTQADKLIQSGVSGAESLAKKTANATVSMGKQAIEKCVRTANAVAVLDDVAGAVAGMVVLAGTSIVNGAEVAWRVVVAGVEDAMTAAKELLARVGAEIKKFIDYLAQLFSWERFLKMSDRIYAAGLKALADARTFAAGIDLTVYLDQISKAMAAPLSMPIADKTIGETLGLDPDSKIPVVDELEYFSELVQDLFSDKDFKASGSGTTSMTLAGDSDLADRRKRATDAMPKSMIGSVSAFLGQPMRPLLEVPSTLWEGCRIVLDPLFNSIEKGAVETVDAAKTMATTRLSVPYLTDLIEKTILGGRKLDMLRIMSLLGAIPAVLEVTVKRGASSSSSTTTATTTSTSAVAAGGTTAVATTRSADTLQPTTRDGSDGTQGTTTDKDSDSHTDYTAARWFGVSASILNAIITICRAAAESAENMQALGGLFFLNTISLILQCGSSIPLLDQLMGDSRTLTLINVILDVVMAVWYFLLSRGVVGPASAGWLMADTVIEVILGLGVLAISIAAFAKRDENSEALATTLTFRLTNWLLRGLQRALDGIDNQVKWVRPASIGAGVLVVVSDVAEAGYGIYSANKS